MVAEDKLLCVGEFAVYGITHRRMRGYWPWTAKPSKENQGTLHEDVGLYFISSLPYKKDGNQHVQADRRRYLQNQHEKQVLHDLHEL
jgi:hypothetical protein